MKPWERHHGVVIIGPGSVGGSLAAALIQAGAAEPLLVGRTAGSTVSGLPVKGMEEWLDSPSPNREEWFFLTVPDDRIQATADRMAAVTTRWREGSAVTHLSGIKDSGELNALEEIGFRTASCHPLQTFARDGVDARFQDIHVTMEGEKAYLESLGHFWQMLGAQSHPMAAPQKRRIHLAAVFLSNYLVSLASIARAEIRKVIPDGELEMLSPLLQQTVSNLLHTDPARSLTGPVERGDLSTLQAHLTLLKSEPERERLYRMLGEIANDLAREKGQDSELADRVRNLLLADKKP